MMNFLSIDVEEWYHATTLQPYLKCDPHQAYPSRLAAPIATLLDLLERSKNKATFFVVGQVAEKNPELLRQIISKGHEIASHGYDHKDLTQLTADEFKGDLQKSKSILEGIIQKKIKGFRAPSFSVCAENVGFLAELTALGFSYDSSILPGNIRYKIGKKMPRVPYEFSENLQEFPISTVRFFNALFPFSGGVYFRILPYFLIKRLMLFYNKRKIPIVVYLHPWELDPAHPRIRTSLWARFVHYYNLQPTSKKLIKLLRDFKFTTIEEGLRKL